MHNSGGTCKNSKLGWHVPKVVCKLIKQSETIINFIIPWIVGLVDACLRCQAESKKDTLGRQDCVVVWGECNHSFHHCCMSLWIKQNNRCPLCQQEWSIQRMGK
ncbi:RING-box protein 2-like isoform X1 [Armigeres subalbatus]|uniref:RING-box protein 2-like isoform X1 n=1 Tax=Armigeres subalbatus TaxID=124917 RepID=UPI002ED2E412